MRRRRDKYRDSRYEPGPVPWWLCAAGPALLAICVTLIWLAAT